MHIECRPRNKKMLRCIIEYIWTPHDMQPTWSTTAILWAVFLRNSHDTHCEGRWASGPAGLRNLFQFIRGMWKRSERHQRSQSWWMVLREAGAYDGASMALEVPVCRSSRSSALIHNVSFTHSVLSATVGPSTAWTLHPPVLTGIIFCLWSKEHRFSCSQTRSCQRCEPVTPSNRKWGKNRAREMNASWWWSLTCSPTGDLWCKCMTVLGWRTYFYFFCDPGKLGGATCFKTPGGHSSIHMTH